METTYTWEATSDGGTRMTLRNRGEPAGFSKLVAPFMAPAMRRANRKDLAALARLLGVGRDPTNTARLPLTRSSSPSNDGDGDIEEQSDGRCTARPGRIGRGRRRWPIDVPQIAGTETAPAPSGHTHSCDSGRGP